MSVKIAIAGAAGRMGQQLIAATEANAGAIFHAGFDLTGGFEASLDSAFKGADVVIDFTLPDATGNIMAAAREAGASYVLGTTGHSDAQLKLIKSESIKLPILQAANYSLGVNVLMGLVNQAAKALSKFDIEILELHHSKKIDAPSGTALALGHSAALARGAQLNQMATYSRVGEPGARPEGEIGFATLRGGDNPGEHTVMFVGDGERVELTHRALDRSIFAKGAVAAAVWMKGKKPGLYGMEDILGF